MNPDKKTPWPWVISSNFAEGMPYAVITTMSVAMFSDLALPNGKITLYTSLLSLPWSFKALWSPFVDIYRTKRWWMTETQFLLFLCFTGVAAALLTPAWLPYTLLALALAALCSASYDIACDGFYMQVLDSGQQSFFVGVRSTAYRLSILFANGILLALTEPLMQLGSPVPQYANDTVFAWSCLFAGIALLMLFFHLFHSRILPRPANRETVLSKKVVLNEFLSTLRHFFYKKDLAFMFLFLLAYRLGEALLSKVTILFLKDDPAAGGLGLNNEQYGVIYGIAGVSALMLGGILGGMYISRFSLPKSIIPMALMLNLPDLLYVWMAHALPRNLWVISASVAFEQFGYGFGLTAYMVYMLYSVKGKYATSHYAFLTCIMALGMNIPSLLSGYMQEHLGYADFFTVTCLSTIPGILASVWFWKRFRNTPISTK